MVVIGRDASAVQVAGESDAVEPNRLRLQVIIDFGCREQKVIGIR